MDKQDGAAKLFQSCPPSTSRFITADNYSSHRGGSCAEVGRPPLPVRRDQWWYVFISKAFPHKLAPFIESLISWTVGCLRLAAAPDTKSSTHRDTVLQKPQVPSSAIRDSHWLN